MKTLEKNKYRRKKSKNPFKATWNGVPATVRQTLFETSLYESFAMSLIWHIVGFLLIWLITFSFIFFGIAPKIFPKPTPKVKNIEFTLTSPQRHRIHHVKLKPAPTPVETEGSEQKMKANEPAPAKASAGNQNKISQNTQGKANKKALKAGGKSKSNISDFAIPMPNFKSMSSGLGGGSGKTSHRASGFDSSSSSFGSFDSGSSAGKGSSGGSGFDKNTAKKIIKTYDISPYVNELRRNIRWNWKAPKSSANKRVELFLRIAKDGKVIILNVKKTSDNAEADNAALNAVRKSMPLNPLPAKYSKNYLDVIFTFDSNSVGSRY